MPKMKAHSGASKRFRVTANGKIMRRRANRNHLTADCFATVKSNDNIGQRQFNWLDKDSVTQHPQTALDPINPFGIPHIHAGRRNR